MTVGSLKRRFSAFQPLFKQHKAVMKILANPVPIDSVPPTRCQRGPSSSRPPRLGVRCAFQRLCIPSTTTVNSRTCKRFSSPISKQHPPLTLRDPSDNWDHMVFIRMFGRLTVYDFSAPPEGVLDLGCGTGLWCIEAAKQWPVRVSLRAGHRLNLLQHGIDLFRNFPI